MTLVEELHEFLRPVSLVEGAVDWWKWDAAASGAFSVKKAYQKIMSSKNRPESNNRVCEGMARIWKTVAPFKAHVMAWRLFWNRLPTYDKLTKAIELSEEGSGCRCCNAKPESAAHLFVACQNVAGLWYKLVNWVGASWASLRGVADYFGLFIELAGNKKMRKRLGGLWGCVAWVIWK